MPARPSRAAPVALPPLAALAALALALTACGGGDGGPVGAPSGATCPPGGTTLRYVGGGDGGAEPASFAKDFFDSFCIGCHSPAGGSVQGQNFSTYAGIVPRLARIDARAAAGPASTNTTMPPLPPAPSVVQRQLLGTWIACGAPEGP